MTKVYGDLTVEISDTYTNNMHKEFMSALTKNAENLSGNIQNSTSSADIAYDLALSLIVSVKRGDQVIDKSEVMNMSFLDTKELWLDVVSVAKDDDAVYPMMKAVLIGVDKEKKA